MEQQAPQEFILEAFADPASVRDVVRGILHTIFFHRFFPSIEPRHREVLDIMLPYVEDTELDTMIEKRAAELARELDAERSNTQQQHHHHHDRRETTTTATNRSRAGPSSAGHGTTGGGGGNNHNGGRGTISVQFFEKKRRKAWYMRAAGDEEVCWECWTVKVTVAEPKTESERAKVRHAMEQTLRTTTMKIITCVNTHKDHIPPITTSEANPFPYQITVNQKDAGWATRMGIY